MENSVFDSMLARYSPTTKVEEQNAIHEVMQEITLAGLYHGGFFSHALLKEKILKTDIDLVKNDARPFIKNASEMDIWSTEYFLLLVDRINFSSK
jgi:hypothetical protein